MLTHKMVIILFDAARCQMKHFSTFESIVSFADSVQILSALTAKLCTNRFNGESAPEEAS